MVMSTWGRRSTTTSRYTTEAPGLAVFSLSTSSAERRREWEAAASLALASMCRMFMGSIPCEATGMVPIRNRG